jgi:hypothetical protein
VLKLLFIILLLFIFRLLLFELKLELSTMKALKLFRALSMAGGLTCFMISCLPDIKGENGYDWMMIAAITLVLVILPTTLIVRIKREDHPETLTEFNKGYHTINVICASILIGLCIRLCRPVPSIQLLHIL